MKGITRFMMLALLGSMALASCSDDDVYDGKLKERKDIVLTRSEEQLAESSNTFAFRLFNSVREHLADGKSFMISPLSVTYALGMVSNGAGSETLDEICEVLGVDNPEAMNAFCRKMIDESGKLDPSTKLSLANAVEVNQRFKLYDDFIKVVEQYYDARVENLDFSSSSALKHINSWCNKQTNKLIPTILDSLDPDCIAVLLNAIYFKGVWTNKFNKDYTQKAYFTTETGKKVRVDMMRQEEKFNYTENSVCQVLQLPYGNEAYSMTILLPREGKTVQDVVESLDKEDWYQQLSLWERKVDVKLPKFKTESRFELDKVLPGMGMPLAFDGALADFSKFCTTPAYISEVIQKSYVEVNESGTEAAAVTAVMMDTMSAAPIQTPKFHANHPFVYIISEKSTNVIFFMGEYNGMD